MPDLTFVTTPWRLDDPLGRIEREEIKHSIALRDYASLGDNPTLPKLAAEYQSRTDDVPTRQLSTLKRWSTKFHWQARVAAHKAIKHEEREAEREAERSKRRQQLEDADWNDGERLRVIARSLIAKFADKANDKMKKAKWDDLDVTLAQVKELLKVASELQRLSTNEPTSNINLTGAALDAAIERELARELAAVAHGGQAEVFAPFEVEATDPTV